jgi:hypothetical protein
MDSQIWNPLQEPPNKDMSSRNPNLINQSLSRRVIQEKVRTVKFPTDLKLEEIEATTGEGQEVFLPKDDSRIISLYLRQEDYEA